MIDATDLPDDIDVLKAMILASGGREERHIDRIAQLEKLLADFKRALFGAKSEKADPGQFELALEDIEAAVESIQAAEEAEDRQMEGKPRPRKANRGALPKHLPRIEEVIEPETLVCACGSERHMIGEDVSERLDIIPAQFQVIATRGPKYACRSCEAPSRGCKNIPCQAVGIVQAAAPAHLIPGGMPTEAVVAHVLVSKYADHLPLYRQAQIYSRQGIDLDRSTLAAWVGRAAFERRPVFDALIADLKRSTKLFMPSRQIAVQSPAG